MTRLLELLFERGYKRTSLISDEAIVSGHERVTVHSSPYAVEIYSRMGFEPTDTEQTVNGLRFIPMEHVYHEAEQNE